MATKSNGKAKTYILGGLLAYLAVLALLAAADILKHRSYWMPDAYFRSTAFEEQIQTGFNLIKYLYIDNKTYPQMTQDEKAGADRMAGWTQEYEPMKRQKEAAVRSAYAGKLEEAQRLGKPEETTLLLQAENRELAAVQSEIDSLIATRRIQYLTYKDRQYDEVKNSLAARGGSFRFYIRDDKTKELYTNMEQEPTQGEIKQALYVVQLPQTSMSTEAFRTVNRYFQQNRLEGFILIPREASGFSPIHADSAYYDAIRERLVKELLLLAGSIAAAAAIAWYLRRNGALTTLYEQALTAPVKRIPMDVRYALTLAALLVAADRLEAGAFFRLPFRAGQLADWTFLALLAVYLLASAGDGLRLYRNRDELREDWNRSLSKKTAVLASRLMTHKSMVFKTGLVFGMTLLLGIAVTAAMVGIAERAGGLVLFGGVYAALYALMLFPWGLRRLRLLLEILEGAEQAATGNLNHWIREVGRGNLPSLAHHLNNMKKSFKASMEKEMRSERMKTELITNVSHDLKTPLTSIINYVDLLKNNDLPPETVQQYIEVLDRKTNRLKALIDDLFEASKMSSGSVELAVENVNVSALLNQALAEFGEKMEASELTFRVQVQSPHIIAPLDGRKTWRVFENLIGNALKYAMPRTRVHLSLEEEEERVVFTIKNVSAYEIDFAPEELTERFKRGDASRHTDGSGLGLAIAKSIVELQGGSLRLDIDGDLFKATVIFSKRAIAA